MATEAEAKSFDEVQEQPQGVWLVEETTVYLLEHRDGWHKGRPMLSNRWSFSVQGPHCPAEEKLAVAKMACAAPALYAALSLVEFSDYNSDLRVSFCGLCGGSEREGHTSVCKVRAALAKARGEQ